MSTDDHHSSKSLHGPGNAADDGSTMYGTASRAASAAKIVDIYDDDAVDPVYRAKVHVLNGAMQEVGMGKYQVRC